MQTNEEYVRHDSIFMVKVKCTIWSLTYIWETHYKLSRWIRLKLHQACFKCYLIINMITGWPCFTILMKWDVCLMSNVHIRVKTTAYILSITSSILQTTTNSSIQINRPVLIYGISVNCIEIKHEIDGLIYKYSQSNYASLWPGTVKKCPD